MYKPNPNSGHEWIRVNNIGSAAVDFTYTTSKHWKLLQNTSDGGIKPYQGGNSIPVSGCAVLAVSPETFLVDHPGWAGILFDITSLTSFNDTSATLTLLDVSGATEDSVSYTNTMGASGDGNSLQMIGGVWAGAAPAPGCSNNIVVAGENHNATENTTTTTTTTSSSSQLTTSFPVEPQIFTDAGPASLTVSTGATVTFVGKAWGLKKEPIENARMTWSFGDGGVADGISVLHVFYYPGEYTVVLDTSSGYYSASDRIHIKAVTPAVLVKAGGDSNRSFVSIENQGSDELDLSLWQIDVQNKKFIIPKNTFLGAKKTLVFASEVTGLVTPLGSKVVLNFPNGTPVGAAASRGVNITITPQSLTNNSAVKAVASISSSKKVSQAVTDQEASVINAVHVGDNTNSKESQDGLWLWYTSAAFLGIIALFGIRFIQGREEKTTFTADDFEIIEEFDENEPH